MKTFERAKTLNHQEFLQEDENLDQLKWEETAKFKALKREREDLR